MKKIKTFLLILIPFQIMAQQTLYHEKYRPQFHFTPAKNWMNDPNGLVYYNGTYHLFFQHNPFANVWGHMSWAHATSKDLIHWKQQPIALKEENNIMIFSGSAVIDKNNTCKFGTATTTPLVAIYTAHTDTLQTQSLAYSNDNGLNWKKYVSNPVINLHKKDFRDPNVFWYDKNKCWVMSVSQPNEHQISFYSSINLKEWVHLSDFGPMGDTSGVWECPDLMQLPIEGSNEKRWALFVSMNSTMQYFTGNFNGKVFIADSTNHIQKIDYGTDYYAAVTYHNNPYRQPISIGWMNNWYYANDIPTSPWKSVMSLPRKLSLKKVDSKWQLIQQPIEAIKTVENILPNVAVKDKEGNIIYGNAGKYYKLQITVMPLKPNATLIELAAGNNHAIVISYNTATKQLVIDRNKTNSSFSKAFAERNRMFIPIKNESEIKLDIFYDNGIVEIFVNDGTATCSFQTFPDEGDDKIILKATAVLKDVHLYRINSIWK